jgi:small redox-active disulfide protein 2
MLDIKVLGPGCSNCHKVHDLAVAALEEMGLEATIEYVTNRSEYPKYGLMFTPGLVVNGKLVCAGRIPSQAEVKDWLTEASRS